MPKESVLSIADKEAIKIEKLIFHIIITNNINPQFLDEIEVTDDQQKFFRDRLAEAAQGRQYIFTSDNPLIEQYAKEIFDSSNDDFVNVSKKITDLFHQAHRKNANDGVFIVSVATIRNRKLLFLIKLDNRKVYEYKVLGTKALLEEVKNTFSEDKSAIQKVALIDIDSNVIWDVLVFDRSKPGGITEFFSKFLSVLPRETESDLTRKTQAAAKSWASDNKTIIDPNQEPAVYKNRARDYLLYTDTFDTDNYINAVIQDENEIRRDLLRESFRSYLELVGLAGQDFVPKKEAITKKETKNIRQTAEGVKIEWFGDPKDSNIEIPNSSNQNGEYKIIIRTNNIIEIQ